MPVNTRPGAGGHKDRSLIIAGVSSVVFAISFALRRVLNKMPRDILKLIYFTARGAASASGSVGLKLLLWQRRKNNGEKGRNGGFTGHC